MRHLLALTLTLSLVCQPAICQAQITPCNPWDSPHYIIGPLRCSGWSTCLWPGESILFTPSQWGSPNKPTLTSAATNYEKVAGPSATCVLTLAGNGTVGTYAAVIPQPCPAGTALPTAGSNCQTPGGMLVNEKHVSPAGALIEQINVTADPTNFPSWVTPIKNPNVAIPCQCK